MRDIVFHNRLEAESVARSCKHLEGSVEYYYLVRQLDTHCECRHNPPIKGVYLGHASQEIVIAGKLVVTQWRS